MNERIQKLAEQATTYIEPTSNSGEGWIFDKEKFAELIIKECGQWFNDRLVVEPDYGMEHRIERNRAVVGVMKEYNTHFGVDGMSTEDKKTLIKELLGVKNEHTS